LNDVVNKLTKQGAAAGQRFSIQVSTAPRKKDPSRSWTTVSFEPLHQGEGLGLQPAQAPAQAPPAFAQAPVQPQAPQGMPPAFQQAQAPVQPQPGVGQLSATPPPGWPPNMPWPGAQQ
jgi:hypothetical protein